jgi:hypothetical protein
LDDGTAWEITGANVEISVKEILGNEVQIKTFSAV